MAGCCRWRKGRDVGEQEMVDGRWEGSGSGRGEVVEER